MKIEEFEGDTNKRWCIDLYGWPMPKGTLRVALQEKKKRWWGGKTWRSVNWQYSYTPEGVPEAKRLVLDAPRLDRLIRERNQRFADESNRYLDS